MYLDMNLDGNIWETEVPKIKEGKDEEDPHVLSLECWLHGAWLPHQGPNSRVWARPAAVGFQTGLQQLPGGDEQSEGRRC